MKISYFFCLSLILYIGCFPNKTATQLDSDQLEEVSLIEEPTKVFLKDASVILMPEGFIVKNDILSGRGQRYFLDQKPAALADISCSLDSIAAVTYYDLANSGASSFASFLHLLYAIPMTPLSLYCISCPKCCFGSCPTVYTTSSEGYKLDTELFSYSISKLFQQEDLDILNYEPNSDSSFTFRVTNEALETHYINYMQLIRVRHPADTRALPSPANEILVVGEPEPARRVINACGRDVTHLVSTRDSGTYRSDNLFEQQLSKKQLTDWLVVNFQPAKSSDELFFVLRLRNTLLTTVLFYDLVLEAQGIAALNWTGRMQKDYLYAQLFTEIYNKYAGIRLFVRDNGNWQYVAKIGDVGPIAWKELAVRLPVNPNSDKIEIRMEYFPDNFIFDFIGFATAGKQIDSVKQDTLIPYNITDYEGISCCDISVSVQMFDDKYLVTEPGDAYYFHYAMAQDPDKETTLFLQSRGYYLEWLRGDWITTKPKEYRFSLFDTDRTVAYLAKMWQQNRPILEREFFKNKIPIRGLP